jgi:NAD(P)-dependent dehydrogenase (short-subunit alcohol dehydrogenase family)/acyl carrier protein
LELVGQGSSWAIRCGKICFRPASAPPSETLVADTVATFGTELRWRPAPAPRVGAGSERTVWLVQDDGSALARSIVERLAGIGRTAALVAPHASPAHWRSHAEAARIGGARVSVVFTAPLHPASDVGSAAFAATLVQSFVALDDASLLAFRGFHCLTRGAHDEIPLPEQAGLWGLGRVCSLERPERWGKLIDVAADVHVGKLVDSLLSEDDEDQLRVTHRSVETLRLEPLRAATSSVAHLPLRGPVLVTGGLGHLGRLLVEWLWSQGVRHVVLTARRTLEQQPDAGNWLECMRQKCTVDVHCVDAADGPAMRAVFARYREQQAPIRTAVHLAGESVAEPIERLTRESFDRAVHGKLGGARVLVECGRDEHLDAVVLFSSAAATWGSTQMGAYALANASLDAIAVAHNRDGLKVCSIAWGRWPRGGLVNAELETALASIGLEVLAPSAAFAVLGYALANSVARLTVASVDWARFSDLYSARRARPLLSTMSAAELEAGGRPISLFESVRGLPRAEVITRTHREIVSSLARLLGSNPDDIDLDRGFLDMGLSSLMALELSKALTHLAGRKLPATLAFEHPTPRKLAAHLVEQFLPMEPDGRPPIRTLVPPAEPLPTGLDHLSNDALAEKLLDGLRTLHDSMQ